MAPTRPTTLSFLIRMSLVLIATVLFASSSRSQSVDLAVADFGVSVGNSPRFHGLRLNAVDKNVIRIDGINLTVWNPGKNPEADYNGLALAVIGTKAERLHGIGLSGLGINASDRLVGVGGGILGVGTNQLTGLGFGIITEARERVRGVTVSGIRSGNTTEFDGLALGTGIVLTDRMRGGSVSLFNFSKESLHGATVGLFGYYHERLRGIGLAGVGGTSADFRGASVSGFFTVCDQMTALALAGGGIAGRQINGLLVGGLGIGAKESIRGVALSSLLVFAPKVEGIAVGALNGLYVDRIDLEDFLHFEFANQEFTGLSIGLVNYSARLRGVQLGLFNYAANNPPWARLLPILNMHF